MESISHLMFTRRLEHIIIVLAASWICTNGTAQADTPAEAPVRKKEDILNEYLSVKPQLEQHNSLPPEVRKVAVKEHIGRPVDLGLVFEDHQGRSVKLGDFVDGQRPVLLSLNYYDCATLCTLQLMAYARAIKGMDWIAGRDFNLVTVSINPKNTQEIAAQKREAYLSEIDKPGTEWQFLRGDEETVSKLAAQVGFEYAYDPATEQYAHAAVTYLITPDGRIGRYLYGIDPSARDLKFALMESSEGRLGSTIEKFILNCFHFDDLTGRYTPFAMNTMRVGGVVTLSGIFVWIGALWSWEKRKRRRESVA
jgi:protein SCO1